MSLYLVRGTLCWCDIVVSCCICIYSLWHACGEITFVMSLCHADWHGLSGKCACVSPCLWGISHHRTALFSLLFHQSAGIPYTRVKKHLNTLGLLGHPSSNSFVLRGLNKRLELKTIHFRRHLDDHNQGNHETHVQESNQGRF